MKTKPNYEFERKRIRKQVTEATEVLKRSIRYLKDVKHIVPRSIIYECATEYIKYLEKCLQPNGQVGNFHEFVMVKVYGIEWRQSKPRLDKYYRGRVSLRDGYA
ncbi:hypothetical protein GCK72_007061 [Caenorhabditis remanei]|uniref:Uncharacterized protein n=1 Tax=Caenorhabditis remanei TaxID=31234 RepID=E3M0Y7_CAERE|nr:hypothetical protein GCK72_007061 [Caenorhabditis remanei]EFO88628.1 hypothetical protein CRE_06287 [Caenorhabditis remanei]KAF1767103.1 hypothetical protein GCK72_007061 [Caenorhabditis remanei]